MDGAIGGEALKSIVLLCGEGTYIEHYAFYCKEKPSIYIYNLKDYCGISMNNVIYSDSRSKNPEDWCYRLFLDEEEITDLVIPDGITTICDDAFGSCSSITSVTIPSSVTKMGLAFKNCPNLSSVSFSEGLKYIGGLGEHVMMLTNEGAFYKSDNITSIILPNSVEEIGWCAFMNLDKLESVTVGSGLKNIGMNAFAKCKELADLYIYAEEVPTILLDDFDEYHSPFEGSMPEYITLHVPAGSVDAYKSVEPWRGFKDVVALTEDDPKATAITAVMRSDKKDGQYYDLSGRKVIQPQKGVFIQNGKKVIVK